MASADAKSKKTSKMAAAKNKAAQKQGKNGNIFKGMVAELKKVHWPTKKEVVKYTVVVLVTVLIMGVILWIFDTLLSLGVTALIK